jgi:hypothetical protein
MGGFFVTQVPLATLTRVLREMIDNSGQDGQVQSRDGDLHHGHDNERASRASDDFSSTGNVKRKTAP